MRMIKSRNKKAVEKTDVAFYAQVRDVFVQARQFVHKTANFAMVKAYWLVGKMIVEKQGGEAKAAYGDRLIDELSVRLTQDLGAGFTRVNLFYMRRFYLAFQNVHTLCEQLSWSHYRLLISVENEEARAYYLEEARKSLFSDRPCQTAWHGALRSKCFRPLQRNLPRPLHHRRSEGNLLDRRVAQGRWPTDLRRGEDGRGDHPWASRINPQGDVGSAGIRQRQEGGVWIGSEAVTVLMDFIGL